MTASEGERGETHGNECNIDCPYCGEPMNMHDDARWARAIYREVEDECEHCESKFALRADTSVYTTARRLAAQERGR